MLQKRKHFTCLQIPPIIYRLLYLFSRYFLYFNIYMYIVYVLYVYLNIWFFLLLWKQIRFYIQLVGHTFIILNVAIPFLLYCKLSYTFQYKYTPFP